MFDEDFFFYWEDVELSNRIQKTPYKIFLDPRAKAIHQNETSSVTNYKTVFIRTANFIYGEFLYDFKVKKLRMLKIFRKLFGKIISLVFSIFTLQLKKIIKNLANIFGFLKFIKFYLKI